MRSALVLLLVLPFAGCVDTLQDVALPPGNMSASGRINPCHGWESDKQLCGDSKFFAKVAPDVQLGQTKDQVLAIMKRDPWRREAEQEEGVVVERWGYPTDYDDERMMWITFKNGVVSKLKQTSWGAED